MKTLLRFSRAALLWVLLLGVSQVAAADFYRFDYVKRIDSDLYGNRDYLFKTRYCYHYSYGESVVVKWEGRYSYDNKIIWEDDDDPCRLEGIYER